MKITCETKDHLELDDLIEFQGGLKERDQNDVRKIKKSIQKYGFATPFFVWENDGNNNVLDGHGRLMTLKQMKAEGEEIPALPVVYVNCKNEEEAKNLLLRINSTYGKMTADSIAEFLGDITVDIDDLQLPNGIMDLTSLVDAQENADDDEAPEPDEDEEPDSIRGEVYQLGRHRLVCGDSTNAEDLEKVMTGAKADLIITDPPYNVNYVGKTSDALKIQNDKKSDAAFTEFLTDAFKSMLAVTKAGAAFYIFYAQTNSSAFFDALKNVGVTAHQILIWVKNTIVLSYSDYKWKHEPIIYGWKEGESHNFYGPLNSATIMNDRKNPARMSKEELLQYVKILEGAQTNDIIYNDKPPRNGEHPTMKPVNLLEKLMRNSSKSEDIILDPFGGSGSTLIAAEKTGRTARLCELDPKYCDVIRRRWTKWAKLNGEEVGSGGLV